MKFLIHSTASVCGETVWWSNTCDLCQSRADQLPQDSEQKHRTHRNGPLTLLAKQSRTASLGIRTHGTHRTKKTPNCTLSQHRNTARTTTRQHTVTDLTETVEEISLLVPRTRILKQANRGVGRKSCCGSIPDCCSETRPTLKAAPDKSRCSDSQTDSHQVSRVLPDLQRASNEAKQETTRHREAVAQVCCWSENAVLAAPHSEGVRTTETKCSQGARELTQERNSQRPQETSRHVQICRDEFQCD